MTESLHFYANVYYRENGKEYVRTFFMESRNDALSIASLFAENHDVTRMRLATMRYRSPAGSNFQNYIEWYDYENGQFKKTSPL